MQKLNAICARCTQAATRTQPGQQQPCSL
ncbi:MAG: hypothetical protein R2865_14955 [Deinococcales bacterium]